MNNCILTNRKGNQNKNKNEEKENYQNDETIQNDEDSNSMPIIRRSQRIKSKRSDKEEAD